MSDTTSSAAAGPRPRQNKLLILAMTLLVVAAAMLYHNFNTATAELLGFRPPSAGYAGGFAPPSSFDLDGLTIPREELRSGGPAKDGIPAITAPKMIAAAAATYLKPDDRVAGVVVGGEARAYPLRILVWHEIVNDTTTGVDFAVTFCPLCDSVSAIDRSFEEGPREFGVSGLLYNSNVVMYDRGEGPRSLWSQMMPINGIAGQHSGVTLKTLPVELTTWSDWQARHPDTVVMSTETGFERSYDHGAYGGYLNTPDLVFPVDKTDDRLPVKEQLLGVWVGDKARAYPISAFTERGAEPLVETIAGKTFTLAYSPKANSLRVVSADDDVEWMYALWFSWYAFRPETDVFGLGEEEDHHRVTAGTEKTQ